MEVTSRLGTDHDELLLLRALHTKYLWDSFVFHMKGIYSMILSNLVFPHARVPRRVRVEVALQIRLTVCLSTDI